jgi:hypothetical protein
MTALLATAGIIIGSLIGSWIYQKFLYNYFDRRFKEGKWF